MSAGQVSVEGKRLLEFANALSGAVGMDLKNPQSVVREGVVGSEGQNAVQH